MQSKDVLKEAIRSFDGTAIIVSHDREFLDGLVTKVYEFGGGRVREHLGGIYEWLRHNPNPYLKGKEGSDLTIDQKLAMNTLQQQPTTPKTAPAEKKPTVAAYADRKEQQKKLKRAERAVKESEEKIARMEARIKEMDVQLSRTNAVADMKLIEEYAQTMKALEEENDRWMQLSEELEELQ